MLRGSYAKAAPGMAPWRLKLMSAMGRGGVRSFVRPALPTSLCDPEDSRKIRLAGVFFATLNAKTAATSTAGAGQVDSRVKQRYIR